MMYAIPNVKIIHIAYSKLYEPFVTTRIAYSIQHPKDPGSVDDEVEEVS
jgi:hypothetical protein